MKLKNKLRRFRFENDEMTQQQLADALGVSRQTIFLIEKGNYNPSVLLALKIAKLFNTSVEEVFQIEEGENENK
jgi:putative transcriptional regulator